jgi:hypothetical protein
MLGHMLQVMAQFAGSGFLVRMLDPDLGQALIRGYFTRRTTQILALNIGVNSVCSERVGPKSCQEKIGRLG